MTSELGCGAEILEPGCGERRTCPNRSTRLSSRVTLRQTRGAIGNETRAGTTPGRERATNSETALEFEQAAVRERDVCQNRLDPKSKRACLSWCGNGTKGDVLAVGDGRVKDEATHGCRRIAGVASESDVIPADVSKDEIRADPNTGTPSLVNREGVAEAGQVSGGECGDPTNRMNLSRENSCPAREGRREEDGEAVDEDGGVSTPAVDQERDGVAMVNRNGSVRARRMVTPKCGRCKNCLNPGRKKACLVNRVVDPAGQRTSALSRRVLAPKCGRCKNCLNPSRKKACLVNRVVDPAGQGTSALSRRVLAPKCGRCKNCLNPSRKKACVVHRPVGPTGQQPSDKKRKRVITPKCGVCKSCRNPQMKKACLVNRIASLARGDASMQSRRVRVLKCGFCKNCLNPSRKKACVGREQSNSSRTPV